MRVLLLAPYPLRTSPSQRFRFEQYVPLLERHGIFVDVCPLIDTPSLALLRSYGHAVQKGSVLVQAALRRLRAVLRGRQYDLAFIHRESFPIGPPVVESLLKQLGVSYVFDLDDAIYLGDVGDANRSWAWLKRPCNAWKSAHGAHLVIAGNEHLAKWARAANPAVDVIPTTIDTDVYSPSKRTEWHSTQSLTLGWSGSATTAVHLESLAPLLGSIQRQHGIGIRVIGAESFRIPRACVETAPWREDSEVADLSKIDIGLMPLPDDEWARGKCGLKALQYMALGIPTVMSPVGVNREIAADGAAILAGSNEEWRTALVRLIEDAKLRRELGAAGRTRVEERYSVQAMLPRYGNALRRAAEA